MVRSLQKMRCGEGVEGSVLGMNAMWLVGCEEERIANFGAMLGFCPCQWMIVTREG